MECRIIYLTCREGVENIPNRLFENDGSGFFTEVTGAGVEGLLGLGIDSNTGLAENAAVFDYDNDGFLDLIVTNGKSVQPIRRGGAPSLLRNLGNGNHWIQLDLRTDGPNYSAVGARVVASSGGVNQLRFQNAGLHRYSQNQQRIHFGLGQDSSVDLEIRWPDGQVENFASDLSCSPGTGNDCEDSADRCCFRTGHLFKWRRLRNTSISTGPRRRFVSVSKQLWFGQL